MRTASMRVVSDHNNPDLISMAIAAAEARSTPAVKSEPQLLDAANQVYDDDEELVDVPTSYE